MKPEEMRFSKEHEWVAVDTDSGVATIGISDYAAGELGDIVYLELPPEGQEVTVTETMGTIEAVKTVADLFAPVSGVVTAVNTALEDNPEIVNTSPFEEGWFVKLKINNAGELDALMSYDEYKAMIGKE